jgi:hypothetical protein
MAADDRASGPSRAMIELLLIGIGTGNPDHLTLEAVKAA